MLELLRQPWPWYVGGPLLGLMVPLLLLWGNKHFGVSSSIRHICAAALPLKAEYFKYDWKSKAWSPVMMLGVIAGAVIAVLFLDGGRAPDLTDAALRTLDTWGIAHPTALQPEEFFSLSALTNPYAVATLLFGGFLVGFGTRYANGCTSGHSIMGLSLLNLGSLVATLSFFAGGLLVSNFILPAILRLF